MENAKLVDLAKRLRELKCVQKRLMEMEKEAYTIRVKYANLDSKAIKKVHDDWVKMMKFIADVFSKPPFLLVEREELAQIFEAFENRDQNYEQFMGRLLPYISVVEDKKRELGRAISNVEYEMDKQYEIFADSCNVDLQYLLRMPSVKEAIMNKLLYVNTANADDASSVWNLQLESDQDPKS